MSAALAQRTLRNSILVVGARALAKVAVFAVLVLLWRHLGAEAYGRFAAMVVYATLAGIAADLGLQTVFVRDVSRDAGAFDRYLANLLSVRLLLAVLALLLLAAALRLLSPPLAPFTLGAFALLLTTSYSSLLRAIFYIRGRLGYEAIAIVVEALLLLALTLYAVSRRASWDAFLWVYAAGYLFTCAFALALMLFRWHDRLTLRLEPGFVLGLLGAGVPLALGFTLTTVYAQVDVVLLQLMRGFQMVGWYSAANKYVDAIAWIPQSAMGAVFPALALLGLGVNLVLNLALIPSTGYLGAAAASTLTEVALFGYGWWLLRRRLHALPVLRSILPVLLSGAIMGVVLITLRGLPLYALVPLGAAVYVAGLVVLRALDPQEWAIVRGGLLRR